MAEGIEFDPMGTVTVSIEDKDYTLRRPKLRQYRKYRDLIKKLAAEAQEKVTDLQARVEDGDESAEEEWENINANSFELTSVPWLKICFEELGDPLPDDHQEWPAFLAVDQTLPSRILQHWRKVPLAPGAKGTN